jgi:hypothetical protein
MAKCYTPISSPTSKTFEKDMEVEPAVRVCLGRVTPASIGLGIYNSGNNNSDDDTESDDNHKEDDHNKHR